MPMTCVAYGCNNSFVRGCGKQFFRFPQKDPERLSQWITAIRRKNWKPSASSRICSDHFTDKDYMLRPGAMVPRLRLDAVPSIFNGFPKHLKERLEKKKKKTDEQVVVICNQVKAHNADQKTFKKKICVVYGCSNTIFKGSKKRFFRFPLNDPERLSKWVEAVQRKYWKPSISSRICSDHFTDKDYVFYPETGDPQLRHDAVPSIFLKNPKWKMTTSDETDMKNQVKPASLEKGLTTTCVVYGCNNTFIRGCKKKFFRFPLKNPERLSKWIQAVGIAEWKPSPSSRICSDHFKDKDYILQPGMKFPRLCTNAVPFVCKEMCRKNCSKMEFMSSEQATEVHRPADHTYSTLPNAVDVPCCDTDTVELKRKVKTLQRQVQRHRHTIKRLSEVIAQLQKNKDFSAISSLIM